MRHLLIALLLCSAVQAASPTSVSNKAAASNCFRVNRLLKSDDVHYWAEWTNACPYTIDAVYVLVRFLDNGRNELANGVWPMYFVRPGVHNVNRFSAPVGGFSTVALHRITTDFAEALAQDRAAARRTKKPAASPTMKAGNLQLVPDPGVSQVIPYDGRPKE